MKLLIRNLDRSTTEAELKDLFEKKGFIGIAAGAFIGEHSFSTEVATDRPDANDLTIASQFASKIKEIGRASCRGRV